MHVVVVGAGPAGSVSALLLARSQIKTTIIDRAHFPRDKICAGALTPAASFALDEIGLLQECKEKAYPLNSTRYIGPDGRQIVVPHPSSGHMVLPRTEFAQPSDSCGSHV